MPLTVIVAGVGLAGLLIPRSWTWYWLAVRSSTVLRVLVHPVRSDIDRVMAPLWLGVSIWIALVVTMLAERMWRRRNGAPERGDS
jgi:hypothetical protein